MTELKTDPYELVRETIADGIATSEGWIGLYSMPKDRRHTYMAKADTVIEHLSRKCLVVLQLEATVTPPSPATP